jgi:hypothetical protein
MDLKRITIIFVGGVALAAWISAAMTPGRAPSVSSAIRPAPIDATGAVLSAEIARLRERLRPDAAPRRAGRNPFVFRSAPRAASTVATEHGGRVAAASGDMPNAAALVEPPRLHLSLAGVAEDPGPAGAPPLRTAIITGDGQLFLAKEGDTVTDGGVEYRVGNISADGADLIDPRDSTVHRLALK